MAYRYYHGRTGVVWNVTPSSVGVIINKQLGNRIRRKKIHVRIEHVRKSTCRTNFLKRVKRNEAAKAAAKKDKSKFQTLKRQPKAAAKKDKSKFQTLKRQPKAPLEGYVVKVSDTTASFLDIPIAKDKIKGAKYVDSGYD